MKLVAFDGDCTLWEPVSGPNLSDRTLTDDEGWPDFLFTKEPHDPLLVKRDDGAFFRLRPEAREVMEQLHNRGVLVGVISYNHQGNIERVLDAFGLLPLVDYIVAEWHTGKDLMMLKMLELARHDGHDVAPAGAMLIDDDPEEIYHQQYRRMGAGFRRFGVEIHNLREVFDVLNSRNDQVEESAG